MTGEAARAARWLSSKSDSIGTYENVADSFAWLQRDDGRRIGLGALDDPVVTGSMVARLVEDYPEAELVLLMHKPIRVDGLAFVEADSHGVVLCDWADAIRAVDQEEPSEYVSPSIRFAFAHIHGLSNVVKISRVGLNRFEVECRTGVIKSVVLDIGYEPTTAQFFDELAQGLFDYYYCTNPNGAGPALGLYKAAADAGIEVFVRPGQLMSALAKT
ncbi:hypothetical protein [Curtobacterium sp. PhB130]|uniref:hypothetical protein n=1 Tax=Curtobacterium sp. PhB130 TaxID=2485178 RepID=UPI0011CE22F9|nr:hypothetical protein [Curtobacterium sp. PhB130]